MTATQMSMGITIKYGTDLDESMTLLSNISPERPSDNAQIKKQAL